MKKKRHTKKKILFFQIFLITALAATTFFVADQTMQQQNLRGRAQTLTNCDVAANELAMTASEQQLLTLINQHRAQNGAPALQSSPQLKRAAEWQSNHMATGGPFNHTDGTGRSPQQRARDCGFSSSVSENIAYNTDKVNSAAKTFDQWKNSPGHNTNMLKATSTQVGLAEAITSNGRHYWTFVAAGGTPSGTVPTQKPNPTQIPTNVPTQLPPTSKPIATTIPTSPIEPTPQIPTPTFACLGGCLTDTPTTIPSHTPEPTEAASLPTISATPEHDGEQNIPANQGILVLILLLIVQILRGIFGGL